MKILFIGFQDLVEPCYDAFLEAIGDRHEVSLFDPTKPLDAQFEEVAVVVDQGGWASHPMIDAGVAAGVRLWQVIGTGLDHLDVEYILANGLMLANTPGTFSGIALAEHALFLMLCITKNLRLSDRNIKSGVFYHPTNGELDGATLGLIGFGGSGRELAKRAWAMGMRILAVDEMEIQQDDLAKHHVSAFLQPADLDKVLKDADVISIHVPLTSKTRHLIDRRALSVMKASVVLINVARGEIVDEAALIDALKTDRIRGAGLDVFAHEPLDPQHPFLHMDNVIATPHIAGGTWGTVKRRTQAAAENVFRVARGAPLLYQVKSAD
jgi:D-3-phosphoglycerate dehydrogenase / 2-oxoglutarate reductase